MNPETPQGPRLLVPKHVLRARQVAREAERRAASAAAEVPAEDQLWLRAKAEREQLGKRRRASLLKVDIRRTMRSRRRRQIRNQARLDRVLFEQQTEKDGVRLQPHRPPRVALRQRESRNLVWDPERRGYVRQEARPQ